MANSLARVEEAINRTKNELNKNIDCSITKSILVKKILAFHKHMNTYNPKFWRWFAVVCGGLAVF